MTEISGRTTGMMITSEGADRTAQPRQGRALRVWMMDLWCIIPYYTAYLCRALAQQGVDVRLASISYHWDLDCFVRQGIRNRPGLLDVVSKLKIRIPSLRRALKLLEAFINMAAAAVQFAVSRPDLIHVQFVPLLESGVPVELWLLKYAKSRGIKILYTVHNELPLDSGDRYFKAFQRAYRLCDALICHTREAKERLVERFAVDAARVVVIPHGPLFHDLAAPDLQRARQKLGFAPGDCVVLWQGWIKPYKGIPFLLEAWKGVQKHAPGARLVIAGAGEEQSQQEIRGMVAALGLERSVRLELRFLDAIQELPLYYAAADILAYPYKEITMSGALMTGLSYGKAIVATNLGAFREVLDDGRNALLVDYGDTQALAEALRGLIGDADLRARLGAAAAELAARMPASWTAIARQTHGCYQRVLAGSGEQPASCEQTAITGV